MRVTKEPEVRKQEILDTALKLFGENGYEKTSITDIAKAIGNLSTPLQSLLKGIFSLFVAHSLAASIRESTSAP